MSSSVLPPTSTTADDSYNAKIHDAEPPSLSDAVYQRIAELKDVRNSLDELSAYIETVDAILDAYRSGTLSIEEGKATFWARRHQLGPARRLSTPAMANDRQEEDVICMLDYAIKAQNEGGLLWVENPMP